ncbi:MAG: transposase [Rhodobacteraceae bacterium]|nr:transposase [Paracoccaceae bacterium]
MIHPPKQDESQIHTRAKPRDSGFRRDALGGQSEDIDGWQRRLDRRSHDRAPLAVAEPMVREVKYECVYLRAFETGSQARGDIGKWPAYYNAERHHSTRGILTEDEVHTNQTHENDSLRKNPDPPELGYNLVEKAGPLLLSLRIAAG